MLVACSELLQNGNNNNHHLGCYCQIAVTVVLHSLFLIIMCLAANIIIRRRRRAFAELARERDKKGRRSSFPRLPNLPSLCCICSQQSAVQREMERCWYRRTLTDSLDIRAGEAGAGQRFSLSLYSYTYPLCWKRGEDAYRWTMQYIMPSGHHGKDRQSQQYNSTAHIKIMRSFQRFSFPFRVAMVYSTMQNCSWESTLSSLSNYDPFSHLLFQ